MFQRKLTRIGKEQALQKLKHYCGYQERSHAEARDKLYSFGLFKQEVEELVARLIEEDYLNEERFAIAFAGGKFRIKKWGKIKITHALKEKRVGDYCVKKAIELIDEKEYEDTLQELMISKWESLNSETNIFSKTKKTHDYLLQKGFEIDMISQSIRKFRQEFNGSQR
jgi:regulatory protein